MANISKEEMINWYKQEYFKCASDPIYFLKNYCYIQHQKRGKIKFNLYPYQEETLKKIMGNKYNIVLKSRQLGISTLFAGYSTWMMLFRNDKNILVVAIKAEVAKNIITKVKIIMSNLPDWLKPVIIENNKQSIKLSNDSGIKAIAATPDAGRSESVSLLIIDEAAFIEEKLMQEIWTSVQSTLDVGGDCVALSCVVKDTMIFTDKGIKPIEYFINNDSIHNDYKIEDYNICGFGKLRKGNLFHNNGIVPTKKIFTKHSELEGSRNHKLWAYSKEKEEYGWFRLDELKVNDKILINYNMHLFGDNNINDDKLIELSSFIKTNIKNSSIKYDKYVLNSDDKYNIKFTNNTMSINRESIINLIGNIFKESQFNNHIEIKLYSSELTNQIRMMLLNLGILSTKKNISGKYLLRIDKKFHSLYNCMIIGKAPIVSNKVAEIWDNITNIIDSENYTYDFSLPDIEEDEWCHSVLYNGMVGHQTPNGVGNWFHTTWVESESGVNKWQNIKLPWYVHPDHDENWRKEQDVVLKSRAAQECFSGDTIVFTKKGPTHIRYIKEGSFVLSHDGTYNKVIKVFNHKSKDIYEIKKSNEEWTKYVTGNHPFLSTNKEWVNVSDIQSSTWNPVFPSKNNHWWNKAFSNFSLILNKKEDDFEIDVYNLEVENTHTYVTEFGSVHNCDCTFMSAGGSVIEYDTLNWYAANVICDPIEKKMNDQLWIWEHPSPEYRYIISADIARGDGSDFSTFHIINIDNLEQVAEFKGKIGTTEFAKLMVEYGTLYNTAMLIPENTGVSYSVCRSIVDLHYPNIYYHNKEAFSTDINKVLRAELRNNYNDVPGFTTSPATRPLVIEKLKLYVEEKLFLFKSVRLLNELYTFIWWANGKPQAQQGYNDDLVLAAGIGLITRDIAIKIHAETTKLSKDMMNMTEKMMVRNNAERSMADQKGTQPTKQLIPGTNTYMDLTQWIK